MLVFPDAQLAYLAVPKTGSTALECALRPHAAIAFEKAFKHTTARRFKNRIAPFLSHRMDLHVETCAVMRAPLEQIGSWYRYRNRSDVKLGEKSARGISFDTFVQATLLPDPPPFADIGSQYRFLTNAQGKLIVDHLFSYNEMDHFCEFLEDRIGVEITLGAMNVSPDLDTHLSPKTLQLLQQARSDEFALFDRLTAVGGYLSSACFAT